MLYNVYVTYIGIYLPIKTCLSHHQFSSVAQSCPTLLRPCGTVACQAPLSMGFSRQGYWSGLPCPPTGDLPDPGIESVIKNLPTNAGDAGNMGLICGTIKKGEGRRTDAFKLWYWRRLLRVPWTARRPVNHKGDQS